jgi:transcription elongation factor GreA
LNKQFQLTKDGISQLQDELDEHISRRSEIAEKLQIARDYGDLAENAEYHSARDEQSALEIRIKEIEHILLNANVIKNRKNGKIILGSKVVLRNNGSEKSYKIVGSVEANPLEGKLSNESPIGKALVGKTVGDKVEIELPGGLAVYKIQAIS